MELLSFCKTLQKKGESLLKFGSEILITVLSTVWLGTFDNFGCHRSKTYVSSGRSLASAQCMKGNLLPLLYMFFEMLAHM